MKKKPTPTKPKRATKKKAGGSCPAATCSPIPAPKLLRAESARLDVLKHAMPDAAQDWIGAQVWAYELAAAFLESLGAPEKVQGYIPANIAEVSDRRAHAPENTTGANGGSLH